MVTKLIEKLHKDHRAYELLEKNGCAPVGAYGKYVVVSGKIYKSFTIAADTLFPNWDK